MDDSLEIEVAHLKEGVARLNELVKINHADMVELTQRADIQDSLNEMLNISLLPISLEEQMEKILLVVLNIQWLTLEKKGCVFLTDETGNGLNMVAYHNLGDSLLTMCKHIQFGQCLCGMAAKEQTLVFRDCIDDDHTNRPEGMQPHGHYTVPIISKGKTLGVLNLYVKHGHQQTKLEQDFLQASSKAMASIVERKKVEEKLRWLSFFDELTGIPNRRQLMDILEEIIRESQTKNHKFAILFIDLDLFKEINDQHGHEVGDLVLIEASRRMQNCLRDTDTAARMGGDEFVVILEMISTADKAEGIANSLIKELSFPYQIKNKSLSIGASIGISIFPHHGKYAEELLKSADKALYQAKKSRGQAVVFKPPSS